MKKYKKNPTKVLQIRLSEKEFDKITTFIDKFGVTRREFILTVLNELKHNNVIMHGNFYKSLKEYAYSNGKYREEYPNQCSLCKDKYRYRSTDPRILAHHHHGYDLENIDNVQWVCVRCHGFIHRKENADKSWEEIIELHKNYNGNTVAEDKDNQ